MKKLISMALFTFTCLSFCCFANESALVAKDQAFVTFASPKGWKQADSSQLSSCVKAMLIGEGNDHFPPTLTLAVEPFEGTLKEYLKIVKNINLKEKTEWKNLGKIPTKAGGASLSQFDETSNWGTARTMTAIFVKDGNAYILSACALKSEFSEYYKDFFNAMCSFDINMAQAELSN